jgi:hypothetical protein
MFLTVHSATGLLIGQYVKNPLLAFLGGFISHYIFDIIPHGDTQVPKQYQNLVYITLAGIIDLAAMISYLLIFMLFTNHLLSLSQIFAILGCLLPDCLQFIYYLYPRQKTIRKIQSIHNLFHELITKKFEFSLTTGLIFQLIFFVILLIINL